MSDELAALRAKLDRLKEDNDLLKAELAELGWTTTVSSPPELARKALRTLHDAFERRKEEAVDLRRLLVAYMQHVNDVDGSTLLYKEHGSGSYLSAEDRAALSEIRAEVIR